MQGVPAVCKTDNRKVKPVGTGVLPGTGGFPGASGLWLLVLSFWRHWIWPEIQAELASPVQSGLRAPLTLVALCPLSLFPFPHGCLVLMGTRHQGASQKGKGFPHPGEAQ